LRKILGFSLVAAALLLGGGAAYASTGPDHGGCGNSGVIVGQDNDLIDADVLNHSLNCNEILNNFLNDNQVNVLSD
jgi:hypothetical protein